MNPGVLAQWDGQGGAPPVQRQWCQTPSWARTPEGPTGKAHQPQPLLCVFPLFRERQMKSAPVVSRNSSATGSNKTRAAGPGRAGSVEDPGLLPWAQEPGSHQGPQSLLPGTWRPDVFLAWVVSRGPGEGPWGKGAHAPS